MKTLKTIKTIDYRQMFSQAAEGDHRIGNDILLLDEFILDPVREYEFTSAGNTFFEVFDAAGLIIINGVSHPVEGHCLIAYLQGQVLKANIDARNIIQRAAYFSDKFMEELYHSSIKFSDIRTLILENPVIQLDSPTSRRLELYVRTLREIATDPDSVSSLTSAKFETLSLFYGPLQNCFKKRQETSASLRKPVISSEFFSLLKAHFRTEHKLKFYADHLNITDRYLYVCVMAATGRTPSYWIDYYMMLEAKKLLLENKLTINQIADALGFSGPSQFGKFFKKHEGESAGAFRINYSK